MKSVSSPRIAPLTSRRLLLDPDFDKKELEVPKEKHAKRPGLDLRFAIKCEELVAKFVLEVAGGLGAVWGISETMAVRGARNGHEWRVCSIVVGALCLVRYLHLYIFRKKLASGYSALSEFLLTVMGGVGAVWGTSEIAGLRLNYPSDCQRIPVHAYWAPGYATCSNTYLFWRIFCCFIAIFFFIFWQRNEMLATRSCMRSRPTEILSSFVLDVMGAAGAVWGSAEVFFLRAGWTDSHFGQDSFCTWRLVCIPVLLLALLRWCIIVRASRKGDNRQHHSASSFSPAAIKSTRCEEVINMTV